jgi:Centrosomal spindle body, CEP44
MFFTLSKSFTHDFLYAVHRVSADVQYLPEQKLYRQMCLILLDAFKYKVPMSGEQFFSAGYAERKIILVLDVYDMLKETKRKMKREALLQASDSGPYPSDVPNRTYEVINHRKGEATKVTFTINSTL